jgi:histidinol-phosphatase (PHP family)
MRAYVEAALARGLTEIAFTDHVPLYFLPGEDPDPGIAMTSAELPGYVEEVESLRAEFAGRIDVLLGLEADYAEGHEAALAGLLGAHDWDVVLGSVHWVRGDWIDAPHSAARHEREGSENLWGEYYRLLAKAATTGLFDVLTHFDLPKKFGHRMPASVVRAESLAVEAARSAGVAVEVSSAGLRKTVAEEYPSPPLLARLVAAGVPIVFSSDAHAPAEVGWGREAIEAAAMAAGAREHLSFRKRERRKHPL